MLQTFIFIALVLSIVLPIGTFLLGERKAGRFKRTLLFNILSFFTVLIIASAVMFGGGASAQPENPAVASGAGMAYLAAALVTGLATIGAGIAVAASASAALGAISENERIMGKALIFVALAEGIALYGLLVSFIILGKV